MLRDTGTGLLRGQGTGLDQSLRPRPQSSVTINNSNTPRIPLSREFSRLVTPDSGALRQTPPVPPRSPISQSVASESLNQLRQV